MNKVLLCSKLAGADAASAIADNWKGILAFVVAIIALCGMVVTSIIIVENLAPNAHPMLQTAFSLGIMGCGVGIAIFTFMVVQKCNELPEEEEVE